MPSERIILCMACGQQNRLPSISANSRPRCGRCSAELSPPKSCSPGRLLTWLAIVAGIGTTWVALDKAQDSVTKKDPQAPASQQTPLDLRGFVPLDETGSRKTSTPLDLRGLVEVDPAASDDAPEATVPSIQMATGVIYVRSGRQRIAPFEVRTALGSDYYVKLVNLVDGQDELTMFIKGGGRISTQVPLGNYELRYAAGEKWYGREYYFGQNTVYSKANKLFDFIQRGNSSQGYTVELILQTNGNLPTTRIDPSQF